MMFKVYEVQFDKTPTNAQISSLAEGVVITTIAQRDSRTGSSGSKSATPLTAKTKPCKVFRKGGADSRCVYVYLCVFVCVCIFVCVCEKECVCE